MAVLHVNIQHIYPDKWAELEVFEKKIAALEAKHGYPPKRRYTLVSGADEYNTLVIAYEWESLEALEKAFAKLSTDPEIIKMGPESNSIIKDTRVELYQTRP